MSLSLDKIKQCRECKFTGLRLYRPYFENTIYCHDCLINLGGIPDSDLISYNSFCYRPMLNGTIENIVYNGVICTCSDEIQKWKQQPIKISDLYEPGSAKYQESKDKITKIEK